MCRFKKGAERFFATFLALCVIVASLGNVRGVAKAETVTREYDFGAVGNLSYHDNVKGNMQTYGWYLKDIGFETKEGRFPDVFASGAYMKIYAGKGLSDRWVDIGIDVPEAGAYDISIKMGTIVHSEFGSGTISLGGKSAGITCVPEDSSQSGVVVKATSLGTVNLEAGENTVRIELGDNVALFVKSLVIAKSSSTQPEEPREVTYDFSAAPQFAYQAEGSTGIANLPAGYDAVFPADSGAGDYEANGWRVSSLYVRTEGGAVKTFAYLSNRSDLDNNDYGLRFYAGYRSYMEIELDVPAAGRYVPTLTYSTNQGLGSVKTTLTLNGSQMCVLDFNGEKNAAPGQVKGKTFTGGAIELKSGINILKVFLDESNNAYLTSLKLTPESQVKPPEFPEINTETAIVYDFHQPLNGEITEQLWGNVKSRIGAAISTQSYGIRVENYSSPSDTISVDIYVPEDGLYYPVFTGYQLSANGGKYELLIDGSSIGEYAFYNRTAAQSMSPVRLTKGVSEFQLECKGVAEPGCKYYCAYLTDLKLYRVKPDAEVELSVGKSNNTLYLGQKGQLSIHIQAADEVRFPVSADTVTSSNPDVIAVDSSGTLTVQAEGSATITASGTLGGVRWEKSLELKAAAVEFDHLSVELERKNLFIGQKVGIEVTGFNNDGSVYELDPSKISYQIEPEGSAEIADGKLTALKEAKAVTITVKAEVNGAEQSATVTCDISDPEKVEPDKKKTTIYTDEDRANAAKNIEENTWARAIRDAAVRVADNIFDTHPDDAYEYLWGAVTTQYLPRACVVSLNQAEKQNVCPSCGKYLNESYGAYPWVLSAAENPWKIKCPNCSTQFPTNDFEAYYKGGIDENGNFDPALAKAHNDALIKEGKEGNLVNQSGQHSDDPNWGVDNGYGWKDSDGVFHHFIAYYNHRAVWSDSSKNAVIEKAICYLTDAYLYTGDAKYANLGIVLLDRISDVYWDMDLMTMEPGNKDQNKYKNSHGGTYKGKVIGNIWEATSVQNYIRAYDAFYPVLVDSVQNEAAITFLSAKAEQYKMGNPKSSGALVCKNIEDNLLRVIYPEVKRANIHGNFGMHQAALALAAVCLDSNPETKEWLDFTFQAGTMVSEMTDRGVDYSVTGGDVMATLIDKVDRDGFGSEVAPGYNMLWIDQLKQVADVLDGYTGYEGADLYQNPKFMKMFSAHYPLILCQKYLAQIGDSGETGNSGVSMPLQSLVEGYAKFEDPVLGQLIYYLNGETTKGLHVGIFESNPNAVGDSINAVIQEKGTLDFDSENLTGYGFAVLRGGIAPDAPGGKSIDFKTMTWTTTPGIVADVHSSGVVQYHANLDQAGAWIEFQFDLDRSGEYNVFLTPFSAMSYGIYDILIDGQMVCEGYNFCTGGKAAFQLTKMSLAEGEHTIRFENARPHETSSALKLGVTRLEFYTDEDLEETGKEPAIDTQYDVWLRYGSNGGHGHRDTLNLGVHAFGLDVAPDNGYVTNATENARRYEWEANTISHNTVVVDASKQKAFDSTKSGTPLHYDGGKKIQVVDVDSSQVYDQTSMYRRTLINIAVDDQNAYTLDLFRVRGGSEHVYSFHGAEGAVTTEGLELTVQEKGSYAGEEVPFGQRPSWESGSITGYTGGGYQWLRDVQKQTNPKSGFSVEWDLSDGRNILDPSQDIRLRLTMLNDLSDVALATGEPPKFPNNPGELTYLLARTKGNHLNTTFTTVIEPYNGERYISKIEEVTVSPADEDVKAVKVTLTNGRVDYIVNALDSTREYTIDNLFRFSGFVGVYSVDETGALDYLYINDGSRIADYDFQSALTGTIGSFTKDLAAENTVTLEMDREYADYRFLIGRDVYVENAGPMNGTYRIRGIQSSDGNRVTVTLGNTTLIQSYVDPTDLSSGYVYTIAEGDSFRIPLSGEKTSFSTDGSDEEPPSKDDPGRPENPGQVEPNTPPATGSDHVAAVAGLLFAAAGGCTAVAFFVRKRRTHR